MQHNNLNTKQQKTTTTTNQHVEHVKKTKSYGELLKSRYSKACFIMAKIENNLRNGTPNENDERDRRKYQPVIDEYLKYKGSKQAEVMNSHRENPKQQEQKKQTNSTKMITDELSLALANESNGKLKPVVAEWPMIENKMSNILDKYLLHNKNCPIPRYDSGEIYRGFFVFRCQDTFSRDFLTNCVTKVRHAFEGMTLTLVPAAQIPEMKTHDNDNKQTTNLNAAIKCKKEMPDDIGNTFPTNANIVVECKKELLETQEAVENNPTSTTNTATECTEKELFEAAPPPAWNKETVETNPFKNQMTKKSYLRNLKRCEYFSAKERKKNRDRRKIRKCEVKIIDYERRNGLSKQTTDHPVNSTSTRQQNEGFQLAINYFGQPTSQIKDTRSHNPYRWINTTEQMQPTLEVESFTNTKPQNEGFQLAINYFEPAGQPTRQSRDSRADNLFRRVNTTEQRQPRKISSKTINNYKRALRFLRNMSELQELTSRQQKYKNKYERMIVRYEEILGINTDVLNRHESRTSNDFRGQQKHISKSPQTAKVASELSNSSWNYHKWEEEQEEEMYNERSKDLAEYATTSRSVEQMSPPGFTQNSRENNGECRSRNYGQSEVESYHETKGDAFWNHRAESYTEMRRDPPAYKPKSEYFSENFKINRYRDETPSTARRNIGTELEQITEYQHNLQANLWPNSLWNYEVNEMESYHEIRGNNSSTHRQRPDISTTERSNFFESENEANLMENYHETSESNSLTHRERPDIPTTEHSSFFESENEQISPTNSWNNWPTQQESYHKTRGCSKQTLEYSQMPTNSSWSRQAENYNESWFQTQHISEYSSACRSQFNAETEVSSQQMSAYPQTSNLFNSASTGRLQAQNINLLDKANSLEVTTKTLLEKRIYEFLNADIPKADKFDERQHIESDRISYSSHKTPVTDGLNHNLDITRKSAYDRLEIAREKIKRTSTTASRSSEPSKPFEETLKRKSATLGTNYSDNSPAKVIMLAYDCDDNVDVNSRSLDKASKEYYKAGGFLRKLESLDPANLSEQERRLKETSGRKSCRWQPSEPRKSKYQQHFWSSPGVTATSSSWQNSYEVNKQSWKPTNPY